MPYSMALPSPDIESGPHAMQCVRAKMELLAIQTQVNAISDRLKQALETYGIDRRDSSASERLWEAAAEIGWAIEGIERSLDEWCQKEDAA